MVSSWSPPFFFLPFLGVSTSAAARAESLALALALPLALAFALGPAGQNLPLACSLRVLPQTLHLPLPASDCRADCSFSSSRATFAFALVSSDSIRWLRVLRRRRQQQAQCWGQSASAFVAGAGRVRCGGQGAGEAVGGC